MEKVIAVLCRGTDSDDSWCERLRGPVAQELLDLGRPGVILNVKDGDVRGSLMTLTTLDPPAVAVVSLWTHQSIRAAVAVRGAAMSASRS
jgi:hypothetical protein